ncbi:MAG: DUF4097 family beta strand repeat protein [Anaerolineae bacterium]|nr:DUF4097 family beta strand repeat protein [Anaerolineae bacterium]
MSQEMEPRSPVQPPDPANSDSPRPESIPSDSTSAPLGPGPTAAPEPPTLPTGGSLPPAPLPSQQTPPPRRSGCAPSLVLIVVALIICGLLAAALAIGGAIVGVSRLDRAINLPLDGGLREVETRSFDPGATPRLVIRTGNGRTEVRAGEGRTIQVEATKRASGPNAQQKLAGILLDMSQSGETVRLGYQYSGPTSLLGQGGIAVDYLVTVPRTTAVDIEADNGEVTVDGVAAEVNARSANGAVTIRSVEGPVRVEADNGRMTIDRTRGLLDVQTNNGAIDATVTQADNMRLRSRNGAVTFAGALGAGPHEIQSSNGAVTVTVPADQKLQLDVQTDNGAINNSLPLTNAQTDRRRLTGALGSGGPLLTVRTNNGRVTLATP